MASVHDHHGSHDHHGAHDHHGNHGDHGKVANDPHIWLDPLLVKKQASVIADGLIEIDPKNKSDYQKNLEEFNRDLDQTHKQIADSLKGLKNREIFVFHPAYGYFCDRYGLKQIPVEIEGKQPSPKQLADLIEKAKSMNVRVIFVQPQFDESSAQTLAKAIDGAVVSLDPLARDYLNNLKDMARKVEKALKEQGGDQ
jgi:zinc transport system substrate-binding protein